MNIASKNGNTASMDLSAIESIVFENNNLVLKTADCGDNYFNVIVNEKVFCMPGSIYGHKVRSNNSGL